MIKVYCKIDGNNNIVEIQSEMFIKDKNGWILIASGDGDKYSHADSMYLEKGLTDIQGRFNYKLLGNSVIELQDSDKTPIATNVVEVPTAEKNKADIEYLALMMGVSL
jgi:hypothetical protein